MTRAATRFRYNAALPTAAAVALIGAIPLAAVHWYLAPVALVPVLAGIWGWRAGTDADPDGLVVRALLGARRFPWSRVETLVPEGRRVHAVLAGGTVVRLPAVGPADLPRLVAASGTGLATGPTDESPQ